MFRLDGKRALVTGAGRGIGLASAHAFARAGAHVTLIARSGDELAAAARSISDEGGSATAIAVDVTDVEAFARVVESNEPHEIFFNNAGTNRPCAFVEVTAGDFDHVMDLNVRASYFAAQAVARRLIAAGKPGSLINMSSQMGHVGSPRRSVYCASKFAVEGFSKAMALELAPYEIRVNTICPTFIETPMTAPFFADPKMRAWVLSKIKLGRIGKPEDLVGVLLLLASDASSMMTGSSVLVDGGWTAD